MNKWLQTLFGVLVGLFLAAVIYLVAAPPRGSSIELLPPPTVAPILVQVDGAVKTPGIYSLARESRVNAAIDAAGGFTQNANKAAMNLAARVKDGEKVVVPVVGTPLPLLLTPEVRNEKTIPAATQPVNLNTATLDDLQTLPGIGPSKAQKILDYREAHQGFKTIEEIQEVQGIGAATFEKLKEFITVQ
jgi:competence protein ComEA